MFLLNLYLICLIPLTNIFRVSSSHQPPTFHSCVSTFTAQMALPVREMLASTRPPAQQVHCSSGHAGKYHWSQFEKHLLSWRTLGAPLCWLRFWYTLAFDENGSTGKQIPGSLHVRSVRENGMFAMVCFYCRLELEAGRSFGFTRFLDNNTRACCTHFFKEGEKAHRAPLWRKGIWSLKLYGKIDKRCTHKCVETAVHIALHECSADNAW